MKAFFYSLFLLVLVSGCATTGVNRVLDDQQVAATQYQDPPSGSTLKCQCGASFSMDDVYFP